MSVGNNLQEMENVVTKGAAAAEPMTSAGIPVEDLGGPTPENSSPFDDSNALATPGKTLKQVKDVVNAKAMAGDAGTAIHITTGGVTIPNSVMSGGDAVTIVNSSGSNQTITQASGVTLYNTADGTTGNRTLAGRGIATIWFHNGSIAYISGSGLS